MTTVEPGVDQSPTAAGSGASATQSFRSTEKYRGGRGEDASPERVSTVATAVLHALHQVIRDYEVTYTEYQAAKAWLIEVGEGGEWPLFLDVFVEHAVEEVQARTQEGTKGTILGPYYLPGAARLPRRPPSHAAGREGECAGLRGQIRNVDGSPVAGAEIVHLAGRRRRLLLRIRTASARGQPRGLVVTGTMAGSRYAPSSPRPYQIPTDGPTGKLIEAAGWHPWRPAHLHLIVGAPGHRAITTQLYFRGGEWLDSDVAEAVKPELILDPQEQGDGTRTVTYDFVLEPTQAAAAA